jgi:uncharacterized DUF497 family protein
MAYRFEWDKRKAISNEKKHGVSFDEASTVFRDPLAFIFDDEYHSEDEPREIIIGHSIGGRLVVVSFTEKAASVVRIISARPTTKKEREDYEENCNV